MKSNIFKYVTTNDLLESIINTLIDHSNKEVVNIGIDFESYVKDEYRFLSSGLDCYCNKLRLLSINWIDNNEPSIVIDLHKVDITNLLKLISNKDKFIVWAHNASFEFRMIKHHYNIELNNIYC